MEKGPALPTHGHGPDIKFMNNYSKVTIAVAVWPFARCKSIGKLPRNQSNQQKLGLLPKQKSSGATSRCLQAKLSLASLDDCKVRMWLQTLLQEKKKKQKQYFKMNSLGWKVKVAEVSLHSTKRFWCSAPVTTTRYRLICV